MAVVYGWILFCSLFHRHLQEWYLWQSDECLSGGTVLYSGALPCSCSSWELPVGPSVDQPAADTPLYNTQSLQTDCSSDCQTDNFWRCWAQIVAKRWVEEIQAWTMDIKSRQDSSTQWWPWKPKSIFENSGLHNFKNVYTNCKKNATTKRTE